MGSFSFADILLTLVVLLITFAILYMVERTRTNTRRKKEQTDIPVEKKHSDN